MKSWINITASQKYLKLAINICLETNAQLNHYKYSILTISKFSRICYWVARSESTVTKDQLYMLQLCHLFLKIFYSSWSQIKRWAWAGRFTKTVVKYNFLDKLEPFWSSYKVELPLFDNRKINPCLARKNRKNWLKKETWNWIRVSGFSYWKLHQLCFH